MMVCRLRRNSELDIDNDMKQKSRKIYHFNGDVYVW